MNYEMNYETAPVITVSITNDMVINQEIKLGSIDRCL